MSLAANPTHVLVISAIEFFFVWLVIAPLVVYNTVHYYKLRHIAQLYSRHTSLSIAMVIAVLVYTTAGRTFALLRRLRVDIGSDTALVLIDTILYIGGSYAFLNILLWRMFLLNFKIRYSMMIEKGEWMRHINTKSAQQSNWYYTHRNTVGNLRWMLRWFIPILCLQFIICCLTSASVLGIGVERIIYYAIISLFNLIIIIAIWVIFCKTPQFADIFGLRIELLYILRLGLFGFFCWVLTAVVEEIGFLSKEGTFIWVASNEIILDAVFCAIALISTRWVLARSTFHLVESSMSNLISKDAPFVNLATFLATKHGIYSFMTHLCKEFSSETLLFIYECLQFKQLCGSEMKEIEDKTLTNNEDIEMNRRKSKAMIVLPKGLPLSDIVSSDQSQHDKFKVLSEKYVLYSAEFQVNLPYECMQVIVNKYKSIESMTHEDLYSVFDQAIEVITGLMNDSYHRFIRTEAYITALSESNLTNSDMH